MIKSPKNSPTSEVLLIRSVSNFSSHQLPQQDGLVEGGYYPVLFEPESGTKKEQDEIVLINPEEQKQHKRNYLLSSRTELSNSATLKYRGACFTVGLLNELLKELRNKNIQSSGENAIKLLQCLTQWQKEYSNYSKQNALYILHLFQEIFSTLQIPLLKQLQFYDHYLKRFQDKFGLQILRAYLRTMQTLGVTKQLQFMKKVFRAKRFINDTEALKITGLLSFIKGGIENWKSYFDKALSSYDESYINETVETLVRIHLLQGDIEQAVAAAQSAFQDPHINHLVCLNQLEGITNDKLYSYFIFSNPQSVKIYEMLEHESQKEELDALLTKIEYNGGSSSDWKKLLAFKLDNFNDILKQRHTLSFWKNKILCGKERIAMESQEGLQIKGIKKEVFELHFRGGKTDH